MIKKINHIGIAVNDVRKFIPIFTEKLKLKIGHEEEADKEDSHIKVVFFPVGESDIELIESSEKQGIIADFLAKRGEGIHHIALEVDNIEKTVKDLKSREIKLMWDIIDGSRGAKIAFIDPCETGGILIEFVQT